MVNLWKVAGVFVVKKIEQTVYSLCIMCIYQGVVWIDWKGKDVSLPFTEMKLRPASLSYVTPNTQG